MPITVTPYVRDAGRCFGPVMFPGENYAFYINADGYISDPNFDTFRLDMMNAVTGIVVSTGIGTLEKDAINDYFYNIMCSFVCPVLPFGWYRMAIRDTAESDPTKAVKAVSNMFQIEEPEIVKNTSLIAYRHTEDKYGFRYEANPNFYNRVRVPVVQVDLKIENERRQTREVTTRRLRNEFSYKEMLVTLESQNFDEFGHVAMSSVYDHDTIFVNNHFVIPKGDYNPEGSRQSVLSNASIDVYVDDLHPVPAQALTPEEYLVTNEMEEITANGEQIIIKY